MNKNSMATTGADTIEEIKRWFVEELTPDQRDQYLYELRRRAWTETVRAQGKAKQAAAPDGE